MDSEWYATLLEMERVYRQRYSLRDDQEVYWMMSNGFRQAGGEWVCVKDDVRVAAAMTRRVDRWDGVV